MVIAQTILTQDIADEIALVDAKPEKLRGEMLDLQHGAAFLPRTRITASVDYEVTAGSDLCIVTVGARQNPGESSFDSMELNSTKHERRISSLLQFADSTEGDSPEISQEEDPWRRGIVLGTTPEDTGRILETQCVLNIEPCLQKSLHMGDMWLIRLLPWERELRNKIDELKKLGR